MDFIQFIQSNYYSYQKLFNLITIFLIYHLYDKINKLEKINSISCEMISELDNTLYGLYHLNEKLNEKLINLDNTFSEKLSNFNEINSDKLTNLDNTFSKKLSNFNEINSDKLSKFNEKLTNLDNTFSDRLTNLDKTFSEKLSNFNEINSEKLSNLDETFSEKLYNLDEINNTVNKYINQELPLYTMENNNVVYVNKNSKEIVFKNFHDKYTGRIIMIPNTISQCYNIEILVFNCMITSRFPENDNILINELFKKKNIKHIILDIDHTIYFPDNNRNYGSTDDSILLIHIMKYFHNNDSVHLTFKNTNFSDAFYLDSLLIKTICNNAFPNYNDRQLIINNLKKRISIINCTKTNYEGSKLSLSIDDI